MAERDYSFHETLFAGLDVLSTAHLTAEQTLADNIKSLRDTTKTSKIIGAVNVMGKVFPGFENLISNILVCPKNLPVPVSSRRPDYKGGETSVYTIANAEGQDEWVLKVNRFTIGKDLPSLHAIASHLLAEYQTVSQWYCQVEGFVPKEAVMVVHAPLFQLPAIGILQQRVMSPTKDIFNDYTFSDLVGEICNDENLKKQFRKFYTIFRRVYHQEQASIDLAGRNNLTIAQNGDSKRLVLLDPHTIWTPQLLSHQHSQVTKIFYSKIELLDTVAKKLSLAD